MKNGDTDGLEKRGEKKWRTRPFQSQFLSPLPVPFLFPLANPEVLGAYKTFFKPPRNIMEIIP